MIAREAWLFCVTATKAPEARLPRVFVLESVEPTKSSLVPTQTFIFTIGLTSALVTVVIIFTKLSVAPREKVLLMMTVCPRIVNVRREKILPCPTLFVASLLSTTNCE
jgi:hypothetical protein